jgi:hypothetical protein
VMGLMRKKGKEQHGLKYGGGGTMNRINEK